ncbi:hypothetical protein KC207_13795 [Phycicoccus sp. BSK3Z-2]|uniref:Uncharacterized protein n=1 Tax=Phycicoccus avicenniae TaxID=2828860 RepID=A0A941DCB4_9MICO|nr:hypothetical protein [Phycicoccus avicenniae]MBR7744362.1 hypothetical protein [Phycicoccus avicenniae]
MTGTDREARRAAAAEVRRARKVIEGAASVAAHIAADKAEAQVDRKISRWWREPVWLTAKNGRTLARWWADCDAARKDIVDDHDRNLAAWEYYQNTPTWFRCPRCHHEWEEEPWQNGCPDCIAEAHNTRRAAWDEAYKTEFDTTYQRLLDAGVVIALQTTQPRRQR